MPKEIWGRKDEKKAETEHCTFPGWMLSKKRPKLTTQNEPNQVREGNNGKNTVKIRKEKGGNELNNMSPRPSGRLERFGGKVNERKGNRENGPRHGEQLRVGQKRGKKEKKAPNIRGQ